MSGLEGKTVIVTGAARGIGRCIAERAAAQGGHVVVADILLDEAAAVAEAIRSGGGQASHSHVDITDPASATRLAEEVLTAHGRIDALVNNAGLDAPHGQAGTIDEAHWRHVIEVDLNGAWWCSRAVIPAMMESRAGRIIFISSLAARVGSPTLSPAYATAKAGLIGLTVSLSSQLEPHGILVNAITPGATGDTGRPYSDEGRQAYLGAHPLGFGGARPIAEGVLHLLGKGGDWMSGSVLNISGGHFRGL
ncbi:SDR family oxidoreductase [Mesorhizobium sp. M0938]|uniref:SDR family NAD(P)-dependent oxidoreductase n=1 Tax=unclassified Mesorhizobium TaxID=325217 RepID=UPI0033384128